MTFAENINRICTERGTTLTSLVKEVKGSSSFTSAINNKGSLPKEAEMVEMARILHCSVIDFFADEDDISAAALMDEDEKDILRTFRSLSRKDKHEFMAMVYKFENREQLEGSNDATTAV